MSDRNIPPYVACSSCNAHVRSGEARREIVAWVKPGKGGSFSNPRGQKFTGRWVCAACVAAERFEPSAPAPLQLSEQPASRPLTVEETRAQVAAVRARLEGSA